MSTDLGSSRGGGQDGSSPSGIEPPPDTGLPLPPELENKLEDPRAAGKRFVYVAVAEVLVPLRLFPVLGAGLGTLKRPPFPAS